MASSVSAGALRPSAECDIPLLEVEPTDIPVGVTQCGGVRPGARVGLAGGGGCTLNFLFVGSDARRYIGTAGHCLIGAEGEGPVQETKDGEISWRPGSGIVATDDTGKRIGESAYAIHLDGYDFALIRLDRGVRSSPSMCHWGGPKGINSDMTDGAVLLRHYGHGAGSGRAPVIIMGNEPYLVPARSALTTSLSDPLRVYAWGHASFGDSGGPVISDDGRAVGVTVSLSTLPVLTGGNVGITRLPIQVRRAEKMMGISLRLLSDRRN